MIVVYYQTKTPISFWCQLELNSRFFIQLSETLLIELIRTHTISYNVNINVVVNYEIFYLCEIIVLFYNVIS